MLIFIILIIIEVLTMVVLRDKLRKRSKGLFIISAIAHVILSIWLWMLLIEITAYKGFFDNPEHVSLLLNLAGAICIVVVPRIVLILFHFTGKAIRIRRGGYVNWLTNTGLTIAIIIFLVISSGTFYGRFNFRVENVEIKIKDLNKDLEGIRIVQLSDMHLSSFYNHGKLLGEIIDEVNSLKPDLILNTGDFVTFGWREFDSNDTILSKAHSLYGNFAVMGNHDFGTYHPFFTEADRSDNVLLINNMIRASGYTLLNDTNTIVRIKGAKIGLDRNNHQGKTSRYNTWRPEEGNVRT